MSFGERPLFAGARLSQLGQIPMTSSPRLRRLSLVRDTEPRDPLPFSDAVMNRTSAETCAMVHRNLVENRPHASRQAFDLYAPMVERVLRRVLGDSNEIEDLIQQVFATVFAKFRKVKNPSAFRSWVYGVTVRVARNYLKRARRRRLWFATERAEEAPDEASLEPSDELATQSLRRVFEILDRMRVDHRIVFSMRVFEELSVREIAEVLDCSESTVKRRYGRARNEFEEMAAADWYLSQWMRNADRGPDHE